MANNSTYDQAQKQLWNRTETEATKQAKKALKNYDIALSEIENEINKAYGKYLTGIESDKYYDEMLKQNTQTQIIRLTALLTETQRIYNYYARKTNSAIIKINTFSMTSIYYQKEYVLAAFTLGAYKPLLLNPQLIELTILGTKEAWREIPKSIIKRYGSMTAFQPQYGTITEKFVKNRLADIEKISSSITQSFIQGESSAEAVRRMEAIFDTTRANAERIIQTEFTRVANAGAYAANVDAENQGFNIKKMWQDAPTGQPHDPAHSNLDGKIKKPKEFFHLGGYKALYPGNFNGGSHNYRCHCSIIDIIDDVPPTLRRIRNPATGKNEVFRWDDYLIWRKENKF